METGSASSQLALFSGAWEFWLLAGGHYWRGAKEQPARNMTAEVTEEILIPQNVRRRYNALAYHPF